MKSKARRAYWARQVRAFEASGQTRRLYCERRGLSVSSLDAWRRRLSSAAVPAFVPLRVDGSAPLAETLLLECASGARLKLPRDCDPVWLAHVLSGLR